MTASKILKKICISCGLEKPYSAFLQISGPTGTMSGSTCATCRGTTSSQKIILPTEADDEVSSTSHGLKIDAKRKDSMDKSKKNQRKEKESREQKEKEYKFALQDKQLEKKLTLEFAERKHRENFLNKPKATPKNLAGDTVKAHEAFLQTASILEEKARAEGVLNQEGRMNDQRNGAIDLSQIHLDPLITGTVKFNSAEFNKIKSFFGATAMNTYANQIQSKQIPQNQPNSIENRFEKESVGASRPLLQPTESRQIGAPATITPLVIGNKPIINPQLNAMSPAIPQPLLPKESPVPPNSLFNSNNAQPQKSFIENRSNTSLPVNNRVTPKNANPSTLLNNADRLVQYVETVLDQSNKPTSSRRR
jgi:hypothetical protein